MEEDITKHGIRRFRKGSKETKDADSDAENANSEEEEIHKAVIIKQDRRILSEQRKRRSYRKRISTFMLMKESSERRGYTTEIIP